MFISTVGIPVTAPSRTIAIAGLSTRRGGVAVAVAIPIAPFSAASS